jgi:FdhD protein
VKRPGPTVHVAPLAVRDGNAHRRPDVVATEEPLEIRVQTSSGEHVLGVTMRTPGADFELAAGFLAGEGVVRAPDDVERVQYCVGGPEEQQFNVVTVVLRPSARFDPSLLARSFPISSACGVCGKASLDLLELRDPPPPPSGPVIDAATLMGLPAALRSKQRSFETTGGVHAAGLFEPDGTTVRVREDIGRHNAVDKVVGSLVLGGTFPVGERVLQVSGRASYEIMQKALMAGIGFVSAVGAPSSLAVSIAEQFGLTLAGFVSDAGFNLYAGAGRVRDATPG